MIWVVFRPLTDAVVDASGKPWITALRGYEVDDDIIPSGGIVLKEIRLTSPVTTETIDRLVGYSPSGSAHIKTEKIQHERRVIRKVQGKDMTAPVYVCEPIEHDAQILASIRDGWWYQGFYKEEDIPRRSKEQASVTIGTGNQGTGDGVRGRTDEK